MSNILPLGTKELPQPLSFKNLLGPSFILLGLGLGSGELILWPYLVANWGLGIIWGVILGITFQFFVNMEIERWALINGESIFVGIARKFGKISPIWFIFSTFIPWMWPGIAAASASILGELLGLPDRSLLGIIILLSIGIILTLGPILYKTVETLQKVLIIVGVPFVLAIVATIASPSHFADLLGGLVGIGEGYKFLPGAIPLASFLAAFAYTGAGGNLNLAQSFYVKEKGFGMGKYSGRITSILTGRQEEITLEGATFVTNEDNIKTFKKWWRLINLEHLLVFWGGGLITILLLALLSYATVYGVRGTEAGIQFIVLESQVLSAKIFPFVGSGFLAIAAVFLFATQLTVYDSTSRIMSENLMIFDRERFKTKGLSKIFYSFLWLQILTGVIIFTLGTSEPLKLLTLGAVLNAFSMFVHIGVTLYLNFTSLHPGLRPSLFRIFWMALAFIFFGAFSLFTIAQNL